MSESSHGIESTAESQTASGQPKIPDHELLRRIGRGSYGEVWLARNVMGSFRAIKIVHRASFENDRPYERELKGLHKFEPVSRTHPGLVSILHVGRNEEAGYFYSVMEIADDLAAGQTVAPETYRPRSLANELAKRGRLPVSECLEIGQALAAALGHLHAQGLVHRDIKPSNIIFVNDAPKLADIGLVTQIGTRATFVGTEGYIPPEGPGSPSADLYSLGKVLYEVCMGKSQEEFPELPTRLRELPEASVLMRLNAIVLRACDPHASKRFHSAEDLRNALVSLRQNLGGTAAREPSVESQSGASCLSIVLLAYSEDSGDTALAALVEQRLANAGHAVSCDQRPLLGTEWARRIEEWIRTADVVVAVLSPRSVRSEFLAYALEVAHQARQRLGNRPSLISVSAGATEPLPCQLALTLEGAILIPAQTPEQMTDQLSAALLKL